MKKLFLLRHAKSGYGDRTTRDFDRQLNERGMRAARVIGAHLRASGAGFDAVIASDAVRVVETLAGVAEGYGSAIIPAWDRKLYLASAETLLDAIHALPPTAETALLAGHNPGLEDLILLLVPEQPRDDRREAVLEKLPTAAVALLSFDVPDWHGVMPETARFDAFTRPRDLDPSLGPDAE